MTVTVILAEPHPVARWALNALLEQDGSLEVVPVADLNEALRAVARHGAPLLIASRRLLERGPEGMRLPGPLPAGTRTIVLGLEDDPAFARDALRAGAAAYVIKDRADRELRAAIDALVERDGLTTAWPLSA
jgi:two-component system, NarL family, response regulator NreC